MEYIHTMNSVEALKENIKHEKNIIKELSSLVVYLKGIEDLEKGGYKISEDERALLYRTSDSLVSQLKILNTSLPEILKKVSFFKEIPSKEPKIKSAKIKKSPKEQLVSFKYERPFLVKEEKAFITIKNTQRANFLKELRLTEDSLKKIRKKHDYLALQEKISEFKKPSLYARLSNKLFSEFSNNLLDKGYFPSLSRELRKANLPFLTHTYASMAFFSGMIAFFVSILLLIIILFFKLSIEYPFLIPTETSIGSRFLSYFWLIIVLPISTFFLFLYYPSVEKKSISGKINQEIPFIVIHMSAIAGSRVEPTNIFKIIALSKEYPHTRKEVKKLLNQVNLYGYDLVNALRNSARITSSAKLAELFNGLATTIASGGDLSEFLDKRAETLIFDYKTEREKSTKMAETFMDIYISVVIAAPMIMTLLLVMMSVTPALSFGLSLETTNILILLGIALINIVFLVFLQLKQPEF